jgi:cation:H+ antiporter
LLALIAGVSLLLFGLDGRISCFDAALLFGLLLAFTGFLVVQSRRETQAANGEYTEALALASAAGWDRLPLVQVGLVIAGLGALVLG